VTATSVLVHRVWPEPDGIAPRGTLIVLGAPGETAGVYQRLADRLAADAYRVVVLDDGPRRLPAARELLAEAFHPAPRVLVGFDRGAQQAIHLASENPAGLDGMILAGLPARASSHIRLDPVEIFDGLDDLDAHTACPRHRAVLQREVGIVSAEPAGPTEAYEVIGADDHGPLSVPVLALHGENDILSPVRAAVGEYRRLGATEIATVSGGRHDILNDVTHRSVAATVVLFLERLRNGDAREALIHDASAGGTPPQDTS